MGAHHHRRTTPESARMRRLALWVIAPIAVLTLVALVWLWPSDGVPSAPPDQGKSFEGQVTAIHQVACPTGQPEAETVNGCGTAEVELGGKRAEPVEVDLPSGPGAPEIEVGDDVLLTQTESPGGGIYAIVDHDRTSGLWILLGAFALALVAFGRWRGVSALGGLAVTFVLLLFFVVPAILAGEPPLLVAIVGSAAIMLTVLYLTHGFTLATTVAVLGTLVSFTLTGLLSAAAVAGLHLTGYTDETSTYVGTLHAVNMEGLLLAGIVIGSLGVLDDVTVTQAATVEELARADPAAGALGLYRSGSRVGRAHIASVVNTIILAYAGSSLPLLILLVANQDSFGDVVTDQLIAQEIVRSVVATLGLIAAVPLTTGLAAAVFGRVTASGGAGTLRTEAH